MRSGWLASLLALSLVFLVACDGKKSAAPSVQRGPGTPTYGDALVVGSIGEPSTLIPLLASDSASHEVAGQIYNGLVRYDKNLNLEGELAESWDVSRDVLYTYRVTIDPKTPTAYSEDFKQVKRVEAPDAYTFRVTYGKPFAPALA